jgi:rhodanese-related sulfurtransferase
MHATAKSQVTRVPAAPSAQALEHFQKCLSFETDCWDVHHAIQNNVADFVLLDVRSHELYARGHLPTAVSLPHVQIAQDTLPALQGNAIYVVYCAGPHCNGAHKAAVRIASLGLPVKLMIGGIEGWQDEGFSLVTGSS